MPPTKITCCGCVRISRFWTSITLTPSLVTQVRALHVATLSEQAPDTLMKNNPFGITVKKNEILDWVDVMFALSMKYAMTIIEGKDAYIPPKKSDSMGTFSVV
jgi:hypothetical protein